MGMYFVHSCLSVSGLPHFILLVRLRQIRHAGLMEPGTDRPALFQLQWLWKNWIWTLLTSPPRLRFQLPWPVTKDYFILKHVKSELTYGAKPQPAEPSVSQCKLISLAVTVWKIQPHTVWNNLHQMKFFRLHCTWNTACCFLPACSQCISSCLLENEMKGG